jgi:hypothetical protein
MGKTSLLGPGRRSGRGWEDKGGMPGKEAAEEGAKLSLLLAWGTLLIATPVSLLTPMKDKAGRKFPKGCDQGRPPTETKPRAGGTPPWIARQH